MADFSFTTDIFNIIDTVTTNFVSSNLSVITSVVTPVVATGLVISLMLSGLHTMATGDGEPLGELIGRFIRYAIVISIASAGGWYQTDLANTALKTPDEFSKALITQGSSTSSTQMASTIDTVLNTGLKISKEAIDNGGIFSSQEMLNFLLGVVIAAVVLAVCGFGAAFILMAKVLLALTVSFGPIAIFCMLWDGTKAIFDKWIGSVITFGLIIIIYSAIFGLLLTIFKQVIDSANGASSIPVMNVIFSSVLLGIIIYFVMKQIPDLAASWGGGINAQFRRWGRGGGAGSGGGPKSAPAPQPQPKSESKPGEGSPGAGAGAGAGAAAGAGGGAAGAAASAAAQVGSAMQGMAKGSRR